MKHLMCPLTERQKTPTLEHLFTDRQTELLTSGMSVDVTIGVSVELSGLLLRAEHALQGFTSFGRARALDRLSAWNGRET